MNLERVVVVGAGYVGLPVACAFAGAGLRTYALDIIPERVKIINEGRSPIVGDEPGLEELLSQVVKEEMLTATTNYSVISRADFIVVCVDTPIDTSTKEPRLNILEGAVRSVGKNLESGTLISIESTLPPLTMGNIVIPILEEESGLAAGKDFSIIHCPERVMPGRLLSNLANYDRVLGGFDDQSISRGIELYSRIIKGTIHSTDLLSAEMAKTLENAYRDVQIAFANEVALACEELGADAFEVRRLVNTCPFRDMHIPGAGVGGHCLPKDSWLFASSLKAIMPKIIATAREVNEYMPMHMTELIKRGLDEADVEFESAKVAIMGLAFLRDSDDTRNSPALTIIDILHDKVKEIIVHDPKVQKKYKVKMIREMEEALIDADCMVVVTDHSCYDGLDLDHIKNIMRTPIMVDGRNVLDADEVRSKGFRYLGVGKGK